MWGHVEAEREESGFLQFSPLLSIPLDAAILES